MKKLTVLESHNSAPIDVYGDSNRISSMFNWVVAWIIIAEILGILIVLSNKDFKIAAIIAATLPFVLATIWLIRWEKFELTALSLALFLITMLTLVATLGLGIHNISNMAYPVILIIASLVVKRRTMFLLAFYTVGCAGWLVFGELVGAYQPAKLVKSVSGDFLSAAIILLVTAIMIRLLSETLFRANQQLQKELKERKIAEEKLAQDIILRLEAEEEIRTLNSELEKRVQERTAELQASNDELEAFSYSVSHDLRAPIRAVNGFASILESEFSGSLPEEANNYLMKIRTSGNKMVRLIDGLLDFSRLSRKPLHIEQVDLNELVQAIIGSFGSESTNRAIEWSMADLPTAQADPVLIQQAFTNLIANAVKYSSKRDNPRIEIGREVEDDKPVYFVRDNGAGFDMQYAAKLFGVFQRLHSNEEFEGTGIGLANVQRIITRHGGRIWAEAEVGKGATFYFTIGN